MTKEALHRDQVLPAIEHDRRERVPKIVHPAPLKS
jgi:hypothetical protein